MFRKMPGFKRGRVTENWKNYITKNFKLHSSANIVRFIQSRRIRYVEHVARMGKMKNACTISDVLRGGERI
jgi:hypothetical protein